MIFSKRPLCAGALAISDSYSQWEHLLSFAKLFQGSTYDSRFAQFLSGFKNCGRVLGAEEVRHDRDPDHSQ